MSNFGVRNYDDGLGRFMSVDALWEKYRSLTPYHYAANNPIPFTDPSGLDTAQRQAAIEKAEEYLNSSSTYELGKKGKPGQPVDCSGMISTCIVAGGEENPVGRHSGTGVQQIEAASKEVEVDDVEPGNVVSFRTGGSWGYHIGLITGVNKNDVGSVISINVAHSSSSANGPTEALLTIGATTGLASKIHMFLKWDTKPDQPVYGTSQMTPNEDRRVKAPNSTIYTNYQPVP